LMVPQLLQSTNRMIANNSPEKTLETVFDESFYPALSLKKEDLEPVIKDFYLHEYNELKSFTSARPEAKKFVQDAAKKGCTMVVATNPLFPLVAVRARLDWAGFSKEDDCFALITSYENMHFAKPNPAYYAEMLGLLGWPQSPVCMTGNSLKDDILPAAKIGIPGFWINGKPGDLPEPLQKSCKAGTLDEVLPWFFDQNDHEFQPVMDSSEAVLAIMRSTVPVLAALTLSLSEDDWKQKPDQEGLSILELISHLADVEKEINRPRIQLILSEDNPFVAGVDSDSWITERDYQGTRSKDVLDSLSEQRINSLNVLSSLNDEEWQKPARHSIFGPTNLLELMRFIALHDIDHIQQIYKLVQNDRTKRY